LERDKVVGLSLTGDEGLLLELDFGGGACAPQKPHDCEPWSRTTFGRSFLSLASSFSLEERCSLRDFSGFSGGGVGIGASSMSSRSATGGGVSRLEEDLEDLLDFLSLLLDDFFGAAAGISSSLGGGGASLTWK
jgi:hypothetical protein